MQNDSIELLMNVKLPVREQRNEMFHAFQALWLDCMLLN